MLAGIQSQGGQEENLEHELLKTGRAVTSRGLNFKTARLQSQGLGSNNNTMKKKKKKVRNNINHNNNNNNNKYHYVIYIYTHIYIVPEQSLLSASRGPAASQSSQGKCLNYYIRCSNIKA